MSDGPNPYDELTALFVTEPDETAKAPAATTIELVVVGSLPVRASLWLPPYADALAREAGPTALLRLDNEVPFLQLLRAPETLAAQPWPTLVDAIAGLGPHIGTWIIRPPLDLTPGDLSTSGCDRITILCSVNDTAIVDAYQRSKALVDEARARNAQPPALGVAVLGSDRHGAVRMQQQLSRTTESYLGVELSMVACVQQIDATVRASDCLTFPTDDHPSLATVLMWIREARASTPAPSAGPSPPGAGGAAQPAPQPAPRAEATPTVKLAPKPTVELEPKGSARAQEPDEDGRPVSLTAHIDGISTLEVRCPGHERLEIGVDPAGRLHVASREADMRRLHVVAAWARAHHELIARACPDHWFDPKVPTVLHVFTDRPSTVTDLYGCDLRLHVLAPVPGQGPQRWYYAPLNTTVP